MAQLLSYELILWVSLTRTREIVTPTHKIVTCTHKIVTYTHRIVTPTHKMVTSSQKAPPPHKLFFIRQR